MKSAAIAVTALGALLALTACNVPPQSQVRDVGNMAYPAPLPQGNIGGGTTSQRRPDVGSAAFPAPLPQGDVSTTSTVGAPRYPTDTGNMAYPAPRPAGNVGTTTLSR